MNRLVSNQRSLPILRREPVAIINAIIGVVETGIILLVAFGLDLTPEQIGAVMAFVISSGVLIQTLWSRNLVSPVGTPSENK